MSFGKSGARMTATNRPTVTFDDVAGVEEAKGELREIVVGLGGKVHGLPRQSGFDITAASEIMAMLCLTEDYEDFRKRLDRTLVAYTRGGSPVTAGQLNVTGAMLALMCDRVSHDTWSNKPLTKTALRDQKRAWKQRERAQRGPKKP